MVQPVAYTIYKITNLLNGKCYVGQTKMLLRFRLASHRFDSKRRKTAISMAIDKYGWESFRYETIESGIAITNVDNREKFWIAEINSLVPHGYNISPGGQRAKEVSESTRIKMRLAKLGKKRGPMSAETKRKIGLANKGRIPPPHVHAASVKACAQRPSPSLGRKHSQETILKISLSKMGQRHTAHWKIRMAEIMRGKMKNPDRMASFLAGLERFRSKRRAEKEAACPNLV